MNQAIFVLSFVLALSGLGFSSAPRQDLDPKKVYRNDMALTVNGVSGEGVLVAPKSEKYLISGVARGNLDLLTITTCHRDVAWSPGGTKFQYTYEPSESLEARGGCPLLVGGYDKKGEHSWGMIDFEDDGATLPGFMKCNGYGKTWSGVSICQSRQGLTQFIEFKGKTNVSPDPKCPMSVGLYDAKEDKTRYEFPIVLGTCVYAFIESSGARRVHRLTTLGYESVLLRE